jgi:hypothetical protein
MGGEYVPDLAYDRRRNVAVPDTVPEHHENVARGADIMAETLAARSTEAAAQGDLLTAQAAGRQAERHRQLAEFHRGQADRRRDQIAGHPSTWVQEDL